MSRNKKHAKVKGGASEQKCMHLLCENAMNNLTNEKWGSANASCSFSNYLSQKESTRSQTACLQSNYSVADIKSFIMTIIQTSQLKQTSKKHECMDFNSYFMIEAALSRLSDMLKI